MPYGRAASKSLQELFLIFMIIVFFFAFLLLIRNPEVIMNGTWKLIFPFPFPFPVYQKALKVYGFVCSFFLFIFSCC